jgi:predicted metal-dependent hydrolase
MVEKIKRVALDDGEHSRFVACVIRKSARAKRISLRVASSDRAILTLPKWTSWSSGFSFLSKEREWLKEKTSNYPRIPPLSEYFSERGEVWLDDSPRTLSWDRSEHYSKSFCSVEPDAVSVRLPGKTDLEEGLLETCRSLAKTSLADRLESLGQRHDLKWNKLRLGNQRSRWGSCSESGTISLNWRLILLPYELGNYVICHELAHLKHLNHSASFWQFLEQLVKHSKVLDNRLRVEGKFVMGLAQRF